MQGSILEKFTIERNLIYILIGGVLIIFVFVFYLLFLRGGESIQLLTPNGSEEWEIGQTYEITWKAKGIERVGIVLFNGNELERVIAKNVNAKLGKYSWKIYPVQEMRGQEYGDGYWIAVFEYPWQEDNKVDYSNGAFAIVFPELFSCDSLSTENEWLYLPSDFPNLRRVFITEESFTGNLGGLEGADEKCQIEAEGRGYVGIWHAFLGGDADEELTVERMKKTPRKTEGVFVMASPAAELLRGATCHRLLAKGFDEFLIKLSDLLIISEEKLEENFLANLEDVWLGRIDEKSKKNCISVGVGALDPYNLAESYSFTTTCQNWTQDNRYVAGYPVPTGEPGPSFPNCYTPAGKFTNAVALGGFSSGLTGKGDDTTLAVSLGKYCSARQKLLCIEE